MLCVLVKDVQVFMYNTKNSNRYLLRSGTVHGKLLKDNSLANKIKSLSPQINTENQTTVRIKNSNKRRGFRYHAIL